ncbi:MAG: type I-E CRISPR-associated protein Cse2/CasB [Geminicoccaceae bacterium]|nr:type I-E CRISPR-associated protein Cse2/CasB [Geminicoccaceae bacterium]
MDDKAAASFVGWHARLTGQDEFPPDRAGRAALRRAGDLEEVWRNPVAIAALAPLLRAWAVSSTDGPAVDRTILAGLAAAAVSERRQGSLGAALAACLDKPGAARDEAQRQGRLVTLTATEEPALFARLLRNLIAGPGEGRAPVVATAEAVLGWHTPEGRLYQRRRILLDFYAADVVPI